MLLNYILCSITLNWPCHTPPSLLASVLANQMWSGGFRYWSPYFVGWRSVAGGGHLQTHAEAVWGMKTQTIFSFKPWFCFEMWLSVLPLVPMVHVVGVVYVGFVGPFGHQTLSRLCSVRFSPSQAKKLVVVWKELCQGIIWREAIYVLITAEMTLNLNLDLDLNHLIRSSSQTSLQLETQDPEHIKKITQVWGNNA